MNRRDFLRVAGTGLAGVPLANALGCRSGDAGGSPTGPAPGATAGSTAPAGSPEPAPARPHRWPVAFTAHGSPMHAVNDGPFPQFLRTWGAALPRPKAILCVSAHWEEDIPCLTVSTTPSTYHDFYNFPDEMYQIRYPCPGDPALAARVATLLEGAGWPTVNDGVRGLDHGAWVPLLHLYPKADIPVVQVSLLLGAAGADHVRMGRTLAPLRDEGVLILGSGNLTHNLRAARFGPGDDTPEDRGRRFDAWVHEKLDAWDLDALCAWERHPDGSWAHPTPDHYVPLLVVAGAADAAGRPKVTHAYDRFEGRSLSMRCVSLA